MCDIKKFSKTMKKILERDDYIALSVKENNFKVHNKKGTTNMPIIFIAHICDDTKIIKLKFNDKNFSSINSDLGSSSNDELVLSFNTSSNIKFCLSYSDKYFFTSSKNDINKNSKTIIYMENNTFQFTYINGYDYFQNNTFKDVFVTKDNNFPMLRFLFFSLFIGIDSDTEKFFNNLGGDMYD